MSGPRRALLLDIGGVILAGGPVLATAFARGDPAMRPLADAVGGFGSAGDELWHRMLVGEVSERGYWATRSAELGSAIGETWQTRDLMNRLYAQPREVWLNTEVVELMTDVRDAGIPLAALTNDLRDFHGQEWVDAQEFFGLFDTIVDASVTGVLKPHPAAFAAGIAALGLPAGDIVYLDDMPWNVDGARNAGLDTYHVSHDDPGAAAAWARERLSLPARVER
jgi:putative hydrolase of the HAD superfamily